ncbi:MAG: DUF2513 domain-containing protein [Selenomonadaceae bacterium]|nr:DUF2513 domain-containing protein [Selenomonadaceae bacterium]
MKLDYECVRNILLTVESLESGQVLRFDTYKSFPLLSDYSAEQINYTVWRLHEAGFIPHNSLVPLIKGMMYSVNALTWDGHQYLDCIRDEKVWEQARKKTSVFDGAPLKVIADIGLAIIRSGVGLPS